MNDLFRYSMYEDLYSPCVFNLLYLELDFLKLQKFLFFVVV